MISTLMLGIHAIASTFWVGGMFFALFILRPTVPGIELPPERLKLWNRVFARFFPAVWVAAIALPSSGYWQVMMDYGGFRGAGLHIHWMHGTGWLMIGLFIYLYMKPYAAFRAAVDAGEWDKARPHLETIRKIVAANSALGAISVLLGATGRLWA
ncbi:MAG: CopD family protein [Proteobacteria bacterium]|nr:CopD family protein [Pseudomonadota bacterium]